MKRSAATIVTAATLLLATSALTAQSGPYAKVTEIKIGGQGGHDYIAVDPGTRRLFVSNSTQMVVIDIDKNAVVGTIADTPRVHGIAFTPAGKGFTSNGGENKASIVDLKTLAVSGKVDIGPGPDAILYSRRTTRSTRSTTRPARRRWSRRTRVRWWRRSSSRAARSRPAWPIPRSGACSSTSKPTARSTRSISRPTRSWQPGRSRRRSRGTGLAIDTTNHLLFSGGGGGKSPVMIDAKTGKVVGQMEICADTDATAFDPATKYASRPAAGR